MKKMFLFLLLFTICEAAPFKSCPKELRPVVEKLLRLPEVRALVEQIGPVSITTTNSGDFNAYWDGRRRCIIINKPRRSQESLARSLLMEMHNASTNAQMHYLAVQARRGNLSKSEYVEGIERIEHQNLLRTIQLLYKAQAIGLLSNSMEWSCPRDFAIYYRQQRQAGHSQFIAKNFDLITG